MQDTIQEPRWKVTVSVIVENQGQGAPKAPSMLYLFRFRIGLGHFEKITPGADRNQPQQQTQWYFERRLCLQARRRARARETKKTRVATQSRSSGSMCAR